MTEKLRELNEQFFELYGRLYENDEFLTKEQSASMAKKLLAQYEREYSALCLREEIEQAREVYELRLKRARLIPRTWRGWFFRRKYNRAAFVCEQVVSMEVQEYFKKRLAAGKPPAKTDGERLAEAPTAPQELPAKTDGERPAETPTAPQETAEPPAQTGGDGARREE